MSPSSAFTARDRSHALLGVAAPSASLPALSLLAPATHATSGGCRLDPVLSLSSRDTSDLHTTVDASTDVQLVSDTLHSPVGALLTSVVVTASASGQSRQMLWPNCSG